jgi:hypothetical protein
MKAYISNYFLSLVANPFFVTKIIYEWHVNSGNDDKPHIEDHGIHFMEN